MPGPVPPPPPSRWQLFLDSKTSPQRLLVALAGMVTAVVAIAAAVVTLTGWFAADGDRPGRSSPPPGSVVESGTAQADDLVRRLLAADHGDPIALDLTVLALQGATIESHLALWYNCEPGAVVGDGACNKVRLEFPSDTQPPRTKPLGWRFRGRYRVDVRNGVDYGTDLDISFDDIAA